MIRTDARLDEAARLMIDRRIKRLPVVDRDHVVGVVGRFDLLRTVADVFPHPVGHVDTEAPRVVADVAIPDVPTVRPDTPIAEVLDAVVSTRLNRAVVIDEQRHVLGIVSDAEMLRRVGGSDQSLLDRLMRRSKAPGTTLLRGKTARELMVGPVSTVPRSTPVMDAIQVMLSERRKLLPVVDEQGRLCGMLDRADALHAAFGAKRVSG